MKNQVKLIDYCKGNRNNFLNLGKIGEGKLIFIDPKGVISNDVLKKCSECVTEMNQEAGEDQAEIVKELLELPEGEQI